MVYGWQPRSFQVADRTGHARTATLRDRLTAPEIAAEAMRAYAEETNRLNRQRHASTEADRCELDKIARSIKEMLALIKTRLSADGSANKESPVCCERA